MSSIDDALTSHVEDALATYLSKRRSAMLDLAPPMAEALSALTGFILDGGKRLRPTFAWWGWRCAGGPADGDDARAVLHAVSGLELIQACALIHDDVMDSSSVRRGAPSMHVAFAKIHSGHNWFGNPDQFGLAAAILLGDIALAWADDMFYGSGVTPERLTAAAEPWQQMRSEMLAGQYLDVLTQARGDESAEAALRVARLKTGAYTVERPLHMGAALAGAPRETIDHLRAFGADIGVAFQLRDDLLGMFGDTKVTGKPAGDDLREGKRTVLVAEGFTRARRRGRHADTVLLRESLGQTELAPDAVDRVRDLLTELDAVAAVERRIDRLTESALAALCAAELDEPAATRLAELAIAATKRNH